MISTRIGRASGILVWLATCDRCGLDFHPVMISSSFTDRILWLCALGEHFATHEPDPAETADIPELPIHLERHLLDLGDVVDRILWYIGQCHDGTALWSHMRDDPDAFRKAVRGAICRTDKLQFISGRTGRTDKPA